MNRQEVLLKEYEVCQQHINTLGTQNWQSVSIFFLVNAIILGFVISMPTHNKGSFVTVLIIGTAIILIFWFWKLWVRRQRFVQITAYERMREIEDELGLWKNWYVFILDRLEDGKLQESEVERSLPKEKLNKINRLKEHYTKPAGYSGLEWMAVIIMVSWLFIILREAILVFEIPVVSQWFLN